MAVRRAPSGAEPSGQTASTRRSALDHHPSLGQERGQHPALLRTPERDRVTGFGHADRAPENSEPQVHLLPLHSGGINHF